MKIVKTKIEDFSDIMLSSKIENLDYNYLLSLFQKIMEDRGLKIEDNILYNCAAFTSHFSKIVKTLRDFIIFFNQNDDYLEENFFYNFSHRRSDKTKRTIEMYRA